MPGAAEYDATLAHRLKLKVTKAAAAAAAAAAASSSSSSSSAPSAAAAAASGVALKRTEEEVFEWKQDPAERARRLWGWWVPRVGDFSFWSTALRLVALAQPERGRGAALLAAQAHPRADRRIGAGGELRGAHDDTREPVLAS